jgi:hypothetical protein
MRWLSVLSGVLVLATQPPPLTGLGAMAAARIETALASWAGWLPPTVVPLPELLRRPAALGGVVTVFGIYLAYRLALWGWGRWEEREFAGFFSPPPHRPGGLGLVVFAIAAVAVGLVGAWSLVQALPLPARPPSGAWSVLAALVLVLTLTAAALRRMPGPRA